MKIEVKVFNDKDEKLVEHVEIIPEANAPMPRFIKLPDGWIRDLNHGLDWGSSSSESMNFSEAKEYCKSVGGRMPTVDELQTILDRSMYNPTADKKVFKDVKSEWYWTSSKYAGNSSCSWCVSFFLGNVLYFFEDFDFYARPVRASQ